MKATPHTPVPRKPEPKSDSPTSMLQAPGSDVATIHTADQPPEEEYGKPEWRNLKDGFLYKHAVWPHPNGKTHKGLIPRIEGKDEAGATQLVHSGLFWEGTEDEWHVAFRKE